MIPDPSLEVSQYLFHHPGVDFIWTTGGPKAVAAANAAGKPCLSVGSGNAPVYVHRSADVRMAVVDILVSKTFDSSVICPAEQTCVIDEQIYDAVIEEFQRMGARLLTDEQTSALAREIVHRRRPNAARRARAVVRQPRRPGRLRGRRTPTRCCSRRCPTDLDALAAHPFIAEKLMPVLGVVRSPSVEHAIAAVRAGHRARWSWPHVGRVRHRRRRDQSLRARDPHRPDPCQRADGGRGAGRRLQLDDADLLARLRHLGGLEHDRQRQLPKPAEHQDRLSPPDTTAVVPRSVGHVLQSRRAREPEAARRLPADDRDRRTDRGAGSGRCRCADISLTDAVHVFSGVEPEPTEAQIRAGVQELEPTRRRRNHRASAEAR